MKDKHVAAIYNCKMNNSVEPIHRLDNTMLAKFSLEICSYLVTI